MLADVKKHIEQRLSFLANKKLIVACSGGLDSMTLVHLLTSLSFDIGIAHCNFSLRGKESDGDATFVSEMAQKMNIPFFSKTFDTESYAKAHGLSIQMAARTLRYDWFDALLEDKEYAYVLTAHHADDDLETFLINVSRGTGLRGVSGIPEVNGQIIRPLLPFSQKQILQYATSRHVHWREDSSNAKKEYLRNGLRHDVIPKFKAHSKRLLSNFRRTQKHLQESRKLIDDYMVLVRNLVVSQEADEYHVAIDKVRELPNWEAVLYELLYPFGFTAWDDIAHLTMAQSGKQILSKTHRLLKDRGVFIVAPLPEESPSIAYTIGSEISEIKEPVHLLFSKASQFEVTNAHTVFVDKDTLDFPLYVRRWEEGDSFHPFGLQGKKKLSKFFKDEKLSLIAKQNTWLLCSNETIVWVIGMRLDDRFKVNKQTTNILKIEYTPK